MLHTLSRCTYYAKNNDLRVTTSVYDSDGCVRENDKNG